jgi:hypothetical protein
MNCQKCNEEIPHSHIADQVKAICAERDRYRAALQEIIERTDATAVLECCHNALNQKGRIIEVEIVSREHGKPSRGD